MMPSFDQKPEKIGIPASASEPTRKAMCVRGMSVLETAHPADVLLTSEVMDHDAGAS